MEDFLFPANQYCMCWRNTSSAFLSALVSPVWFLHQQRGILLFLRLEFRLIGHRGEWDFIWRLVIYPHIMKTHPNGSSPMQGLSQLSAGPVERFWNVCCPVDLGKPEVNTDPTCWFIVWAPTAAQNKQANWEQLLVSPQISPAVGAHSG